jgi:hypothetical protein
VIKLNLATLASSDVTPPKDPMFPEQGGFAGVSVDRQRPTNVVVSTMDRWWPPPYDQVYRSVNGGASWSTTAAGLPGSGSAPWSSIRTPHWAGDVEIDPFNSNRAWYITGYGIFSCNNLMTGTGNWTFTSDGLEEFFTFCVVSPPSGPLLFTSHGDQGSFRHLNLDTSPPMNDYLPHPVNSFGIDFAENNPNIVVRLFQDAPFGAYSLDGGVTWQDFATSPPGASGNQPPSNIAISADGGRIVWIPQNSIAYYSTNRGVNWTASTGGPTGTRVPISDRVNSNKFYIYSGSSLYVSTNGGANFASASILASGLTPRTVFGREGHLWLPRGNSGLSRTTNSGSSFTTVASVQRATFIGFGMAAPGQSYPAIFISGRVTNIDGIFRSDDEGVSWVRINDDQHQFTLQNIHSFCGDPRVYGRVYFGTEGRGVFYGDLQPSPPAIPLNLLTLAGDSQVALSWNASPGATNYYVKRSTISGSGYALITTNSSVVFTNNGLNNGTLYYYVVSALGIGGESGNSIEASARPTASAPTEINLTTIAGGQLQVAWPADYTGWLLQIQTNAPGVGLGTNWTSITGSDATNQFTVPADPAQGSVFFRLVHPPPPP